MRLRMAEYRCLRRGGLFHAGYSEGTSIIMPTIRNTHRCKPANPDMRPRKYRFVLYPLDLKHPDYHVSWNECLKALSPTAKLSNHGYIAEDVLRIMEGFATKNGKIVDFQKSSSPYSPNSEIVITFTKRPPIGEKLRKAMKLP